MNVVVTAGEEMSKFVSEEDGKKSEREGQSGGERGGLAIDESESADEFVPGDGLVVGVGGGEMRSGYETSAKCQKKEGAGDEERFARGVSRDRKGIKGEASTGAPVGRGLGNGEAAVWE